MNRFKLKGLILCLFLLFILIGRSKPVVAELELTNEERDYIDRRKAIIAVSKDGSAPLHFINSKGEITGISISVLDKIGDMTGLTFEYKLYDSIKHEFEDNSDIILAVAPNYVPADLILSQPYLKSETILFINTSVDSNKLEDEIYASIKGGSLPDGVKEENTIYYNSREETLDAVESGQADYGYGNEYSIAFYTLQNGYKNIIPIPKAKESREYSIGFLKNDEILLSIINKSIDAIDDSQMNKLILEVSSQIERKVTLPMIVDTYGRLIFGIIGIVISILLLSIILNIRDKKGLSLQNKKYEMLSQISNEYLFEYDIKTDHLELSEKFVDLFGMEGNLNGAISILKKIILNRDSDENVEIIRLSLGNGKTGVFKAIKSIIYTDKGEIYYIVGKLINISEEAAEKEKLIVKAQMDGLTGIYNDITTKKLIDESIRNKDNNEKDALLLIDCDKFKNINDTLGHLAGDQALKNVSKALRDNLRGNDIIGRIGGDEFCVYMKNVPSYKFVQSRCDRLIAHVQEMDKDFNLTLSIGIAFLKDEKTHDELFKKADYALYESKSTGGAKAVSLEL